MTLKEKRISFARMIPKLIDMAFALGFDVSVGDVFRDHRCPYGSTRSAHHKGLAIDLNLYDRRTGKYLTDTESHRCLGEWWERQGMKWGGRFKGKNADGNHYEFKEGPTK